MVTEPKSTAMAPSPGTWSQTTGFYRCGQLSSISWSPLYRGWPADHRPLSSTKPFATAVANGLRLSPVVSGDFLAISTPDISHRHRHAARAIELRDGPMRSHTCEC